MAQAVYLHIGVPKSGTTFVQEVLWSHRTRLDGLGFSLAADNFAKHVRAAGDLCARRTGQRAVGAWDKLAESARQQPGNVIISQEQLCRADAAQIERAVTSFGEAPVTVVLTVRDLVRQITSNWQQQVKSRYTGQLPEMIDEIVNRRPTYDDFWQHQDVLAVADRWLDAVPLERFVVVTVPHPGQLPEVLWWRFAAACDLTPTGFDVEVERPNESLGSVQVELLRRVNLALGERLPLQEGYPVVRRLLANKLLTAQPDPRPLGVDEQTHAWASEVTGYWADVLRERGVRVVGDLDELSPAPWVPPGRDADAVLDAALVDSAAAALADLLALWQDNAGKMPPRGVSGIGGAERRTD